LTVLSKFLKPEQKAVGANGIRNVILENALLIGTSIQRRP